MGKTCCPFEEKETQTHAQKRWGRMLYSIDLTSFDLCIVNSLNDLVKALRDEMTQHEWWTGRKAFAIFKPVSIRDTVSISDVRDVDWTQRYFCLLIKLKDWHQCLLSFTHTHSVYLSRNDGFSSFLIKAGVNKGLCWCGKDRHPLAFTDSDDMMCR